MSYYFLSMPVLACNLAIKLRQSGFKVKVWSAPENCFLDITSDVLLYDAFYFFTLKLEFLRDETTKDIGLHFYTCFYTQKGLKRQRNLSKNNFAKLKAFLEEKVFLSGNLKVRKYYKTKRCYWQQPKIEHWTPETDPDPEFFPEKKPRVFIEIYGWLEEVFLQTNGEG